MGFGQEKVWVMGYGVHFPTNQSWWIQNAMGFEGFDCIPTTPSACKDLCKLCSVCSDVLLTLPMECASLLLT